MEEIVKHTVRMPPLLKRRILLHRAVTGINSNRFTLDAIERALDEAGIPKDASRIKRRNTAKSA